MNDHFEGTAVEDGLRSADPADLGIDPGKLETAVRFALANESDLPKDLDRGILSVLAVREPPPWNEIIGPVKPRGSTNGIILRRGRVVADWGDTERVDMTFSVTKSYLALVAGVAVARGLIRSVDDPVREYALDDGFDSAQNRAITWRHLLQQTSEWEGELWGKPDLVDRNRQVGVDADNSRKGTFRPLQRPGTYFEYNDVRVNRLALSLLHVFRRPLPEVLKEAVMDPIGASDSWEWHGYRNSVVVIDGRPMVSVAGGGHWGGGLWISSRDHARIGQLVLQKGRWNGREILPETWIEEMTAPSPCNPDYGYLWWLNTRRKRFPSAPASSVFALGAGSHAIWIEPETEIVMVVRWIRQECFDELIRLVMESL